MTTTGRLTYTQAVEAFNETVLGIYGLLDSQVIARLDKQEETLGNIQKEQADTNEHLVQLNGQVAQNTRDVGQITVTLGTLPCASNEVSIARLEERMEMNPTPREMGRLEERQEVHRSNWSKTWNIAKIPITFAVTAALTTLLTLALAGKIP